MESHRLPPGTLLKAKTDDDLLFVKGVLVGHIDSDTVLLLLSHESGGFMIVASPLIGEILIHESDVTAAENE